MAALFLAILPRSKISIHQRAFSLLELLCSMVLLASIITLFLSFSSSLWKKWQQQADEEKKTSQLSSLLEQITHDLHSSVMLERSFFINLPTVDPRCRKNLIFLTLSSLNSEEDLRAVGYFLIQEEQNASSATCYRFLANAQETRTALEHENITMLFSSISLKEITASPPMASSILEWKINPVWLIDGAWTQVSSSSEGSYEQSPSLLEINIALQHPSPASFSKKIVATNMFSTTIALPPKP